MHINAGDIKIANTLLALLSLDHTLHKNDKSCPWKALLSSSVKWETLLQQVHILKCSATNSGIVNSCAVLLTTQLSCFGKKSYSGQLLPIPKFSEISHQTWSFKGCYSPNPTSQEKVEKDGLAKETFKGNRGGSCVIQRERPTFPCHL